MASAIRGESSNPYGGGLGTGGKFRKPTARKSQKTPYDRPSTSVRLGGGEDRVGGCWLSKLVDPGRRFIAYSAQRFFASVFQKRLGSGETPVQSPEQKQIPERDVIPETKVGGKENTPALSMKNDVIRMEDTNAPAKPTKDGFVDFEKIFKEKTFTRSEVDRLTTLLRSRAADSSTVNGEQRNEVSILRHPPSQERERVHPDNGSMNALVSTPLRNSRADECTASPAQLAKAYMGSRPSEVTPSMLGLRGQGVREDSVFLNRTPFPSKSPTMSLGPKPSGKRPLENGFVTPRSRGRSAVYSMARTPYSRPQSAVKASPSTWEESLSSGSRQGFQSGIKRRSSVLDNDIGSVGPVRRIRQKSNLSSRSLALPASESPLSVRANGGPKTTYPSKDSAEDIPGSSFNLVPSQSTQMASKILEQLDKLVSTREKSPSKLSPSMLRGPALRSLQNVEAPKFIDNLPEKKANSPGSSYQKQEESRASISREALVMSEKTGAVDGASKTVPSKDQETRGKGTYMPLTSSLEEHPPKKRAFRMSAHEDFLELDDDHGEASTSFAVAEKQNASKVEKGVGFSMPIGEKPPTSSVAMPSTSYIANGDDSQGTSNGSREIGRSKFAASPDEAVQQSNMASEPISQSTQGTEKSSISPSKLISEEKVISLEEPKKAAAVFPTFLSSPAATDLTQNTGASADIKLEKTISSAFKVSEASAKPTESIKAISNSASEAESTFNGSKFLAGANAVTPPLDNGFLGSSPSFPPSIFNIPSGKSVSEVPSTLQSVAATLAFGQSPVNTSNDSNSGSNSQSTSAPSLSSTSVFKFGEPAAQFPASTVSASTDQISKETELKNQPFGNLNPYKFSTSAHTNTANAFATKPAEIQSSAPAVADAAINVNGGTSSVAGGSTLSPSTAASSAPGIETSTFARSSVAPTETSVFGTSFPVFTGPGSSMSGSVAASTASSVFSFSAVSTAPAASSQSMASNPFGTANAQMGKNGIGTTTSTQSAPFQFGSPASAPFGFSGNTSLVSNSSPFGLSKSEPLVFASVSTPQLSSTNTSASSSGTMSSSSSPFGKSWQAPSTLSTASLFSSPSTTCVPPSFNFGSSASASANSFNFGGSSASAPSFMAPTNTPSSAPKFGFGATTPITTPQPQFGNSSPGFAFATPTNNTFNSNQQMSMEDSMAEDTDQANRASMVPQNPFGQPSVSMPQQHFGFGGGQATPAPSMANPFQFGVQQNASTPQNAQPFQTSQSLENPFQGGGGSFSLGSTGGGDKSGRRIIKARKTNRKK
ncbi:hypothetical protein AALP_AA3G115600 [Arabis alpina]|uniref:Nuclear pore complex protein NUP1 n=1 Tax=Arabis alpina TaxID=50452 RepID=A0A087H8K3_ARAAL|nr:hypothetical protein AALP_AA3G115600 [Arabis alpina]